MKKLIFRILLMAVTLLTLFLNGCATQQTVDMAESYNNAYVAHVANDQMAIQSKATAIKETFDYDCKDGTEACGVAKALSAVIASRDIASIQPAPFTLQKHATDVDAQIKALDVVGDGIPVITMGAVAVKAIDDDNGTVNNNADNGATVNNSFDEDHATNFGETGTASNLPAQNNSSESTEVAE